MNKGSIHPFMVMWGYHGDATLEIVKLILHEDITGHLSEGIKSSLKS